MPFVIRDLEQYFTQIVQSLWLLLNSDIFLFDGPTRSTKLRTRSLGRVRLL